MPNDISRLVFDYSKNGKLVDTHFINKLIEIVVNANHLNNYVKNLVFSNLREADEGFAVAGYDLIGGNILVSIDAINKVLENMEYSDRYAYLFTDVEQIFRRNLIITQFILHELEHAKQNKQANSKDTDLETKLLKASFRESQTIKNPKVWELIFKGEINPIELVAYIAIKKAKYEQYYKENPSERLAQIRSYKTITDVLEPIKDLVPNLSQFEQASLVEQMLAGYSYDWSMISAPTPIYLEGLGYSNIWENLDFYDSNIMELQNKVADKYDLAKRLILGLPINDKEYENTSNWLHSSIKY